MQIRSFTNSPIVLSLYFCGTSHQLEPLKWTAGLLYRYDTGLDIDHANDVDFENSCSFKMGFNGCGIEYGAKGILFGSGIEDQCNKVIAKITLLKEKLEKENSKQKIIVNCYGHSRGGITALFLAKLLGHYPPDQLEINLALMDPVPGNLIMSAKLDILHLTLTNQVIDLSQCHNLNQVMALYPYIPLPDYAFHAPILPNYPSRTLVDEDIILGCHAGAEKIGEDAYFYAAPRFIEFLELCGTVFNPQIKALAPSLTLGDYELIPNDLLPSPGEIVIRDCHATAYEKSQIHFSRPENDIGYINSHHCFFSTGISNAQRKIDTQHNTFQYSDILLLAQLITAVRDQLTKISKRSHKGILLLQLNSYFAELNPDMIPNNAIHNTVVDGMRFLVNIALQRDRNPLSIYTSTQSGNALLELLRLKKYFNFASLVLGTTYHIPTYTDLCSFAGGFVKEHFNAQLKEPNWFKIQDQLDEMCSRKRFG